MSEDADDDSKTEDATSRKLDKAHEQGDYAKSRELNVLTGMIGLLIAVYMIPGIARDLNRDLIGYIANLDSQQADFASIGHVLVRSFWSYIKVIFIPLLITAFLGALATIYQVGFSFNTSLLKFDIGRMNPLKGLQRIFSMKQQVVEILKSLPKLMIVGYLAYTTLKPLMISSEHTISTDLRDMLFEVYYYVKRLLFGVILAIVLIAIGDYFYQNYSYNKRMRMTKEEVKDEHKMTEGDPVVKGRMRSLRIQKARQRMMAAVPKADVVITNPTHFAVALKYDPASDSAPIVLALGADQLAFNMRRIATEHDIPIIENPPLARALFDSAEVDQEIPAEHYRAVAEVISYVFKLKGKSL